MQVQSEFKPKYGAKAKTAAAHAFDRQFGSRLKYHMEYCINNPGEISKIHRVKAKVDEVKGIMVQNIEKVRPQSAALQLTSLHCKQRGKTSAYQRVRTALHCSFCVSRSICRAGKVKTFTARNQSGASQISHKPLSLHCRSTCMACVAFVRCVVCCRCWRGERRSRCLWTRQKISKIRHRGSRCRGETCATRCGGKT
jgi:hypothetical protein